jgi:hypothetical protein
MRILYISIHRSANTVHVKFFTIKSRFGPYHYPHSMMTYGRVKVQLHALLTSGICRGEWGEVMFVNLLESMLVGRQNHPEHSDGENSLQPLPGIRPQSLGCSAHELVTIETMLYHEDKVLPVLN